MMNTVRIQEQTGLRLVNFDSHMMNETSCGIDASLLARRLCSASGYSEAVLAPSGAEAQARAIALARAYGMKKYGFRRSRILVLTNRKFDLRLVNGEGFSRAKFQEPEDLREKLDGTVCALFFSFWEPGGETLSQEYVKELFRLCRSAGVLTVSDETGLGLGRTGTLLAGEGYGVKPDITVVSHGPSFGACLLRGGLGAGETGAGPGAAACAEAVAALEELTIPGALERIGEKGAYLAAKLRQMKGLDQIRGLGLALSAVPRGQTAAQVASEAGTLGLCLSAQNEVLLFRPDLHMEKSELAQALARLAGLLSGQ